MGQLSSVFFARGVGVFIFIGAPDLLVFHSEHVCRVVQLTSALLPGILMHSLSPCHMCVATSYLCDVSFPNKKVA